MKNWILGIIIVSALLIGIGVYFYATNTGRNNSNNYQAERTGTETNTSQNNASNEEEKKVAEEAAKKQAEEQAQAEAAAAEQAAQQEAAKEPTEAEEIGAFSTKIYTKDSNRQNNITITCSILNDTDVENGETFSFCNTVGQSSPSKGYKKADVYKNGEKAKGYGGGNCQISTTLYNAVLEAPGLKVTERHEHSNKVPYIQDGKDAAVAYGSYDFKFVNNTGSTIRIKASNTPDLVSVSLVKLE